MTSLSRAMTIPFVPSVLAFQVCTIETEIGHKEKIVHRA
jgi:hypothetical protein